MTYPDLHKLPRLYIDAPFGVGEAIALESRQFHYLRNVLRKKDGDVLRLFNGRDGEWLARLSSLSKKRGEILLEDCVYIQPQKRTGQKCALYFSPIKKQRMDMLIEKAVELGVDELHPILMHRSVMRKVNEERMRAQIIEAAEQCERMDIPFLYPMCMLDEMLVSLDTLLYACVERSQETSSLSSCDLSGGSAFLIGPEGGFEESEVKQILVHKHVHPVSLGDSILRAETAALSCLAWARFG